ncbi:M15 family metallopeptidase [Oenococcus sp.]|uniref:M15 family metallopeptidase n=1 Tax=Oenococcus sp. TaxID=1979414 RepID=UPI0039EB02E1
MVLNAQEAQMTPIKKLVDLWDNEQVRQIRIIPENDPLVSLNYFPEKIIISPQYFIQGLDGALPDLYARERVYQQLLKAAALLPTGYKFVIFDAWRSIATQMALFEKMKGFVLRDHPDFDDKQVTTAARRIVALPATDIEKPSPHNTGASLDLSIADASGRLLDMGGNFDDAGAYSRTDFYEDHTDTPQDQQAQENRRLLYQLMITAGFSNYIEEWWHFDYGNQNWAYALGKDHALFGATSPKFPWI